MSFSNYIEGQVLRWVFDKTPAYTPPTTFYVSLHTAVIGDSTTFPHQSEPSSGFGYTRMPVPWTNPITGSGGYQEVRNIGHITFPPATGSWGTIKGLGVWDAQVSGNVLMFSTPEIEKTVDTGDVYIIPQQALIFRIN